jgi:surface polysaccharide O-acyltransferase-like enzyme
VSFVDDVNVKNVSVDADVDVSVPVREVCVSDVSFSVDLIRVVAIMLVVLLHASNEYYTAIQQSPLESALHWWTSTTYKTVALPCVPLFVMLSGALLLQPSKVNEPILVFLKKRARRIGFAFFFWGSIYLAWSFYLTGTPVTLYNVVLGFVFGLFTGPYYHFWFLYLIAGLYLITPILRAVVAFKDAKILRYLVLVWFLGVGIVPLVNLILGMNLNTSVVVLGGSVGYFVFGAYSQKIRVRSWILMSLFALGVAWTIVSTWLMRFTFYPLNQQYFFFDYLAANVIVMSVSLFMLLSKVRQDWLEENHPFAKRVLHLISCNTLPIYLFHVIILESLQRGFFGFKLSLTVINPVVGVPLITLATFGITFGLVLIMKKVPALKRLIG